MWRYRLTIEVPFLLFYSTCLMVGNLIVNLMTYKVCYNILHYPEANCSRLGRYTDKETLELEKIVQPYAGTINVVVEMVPCAVPVLLTLILGSWSDKYGRKPVLLYVLCCMTIGFASNAIILLFKEINPWYIIMAAIPSMVCGGTTTFFTVTLAYLNDISTPKTRALRMVTFDVILILSSLFGGLSSSFVLYATSYAAVYGIGSAFVAFSAIYTYFFIPESLQNKSNEKPSLSNVFTCNNITQLFKLAGKKRPHYKRSIILLIILSVTLLGIITNGEGNVKTQYLRNKLGWTLTKRNVFGSWSSAVIIISTLTITFLMHNLKAKEIALILLAQVSGIGSSLLYSTADSDEYIYASVPVGLFGGLANPLLRTILAKMMVSSEMGKIFSLLMVLNSFCLLGSALAYQQIYNNTLETHPEMFNYVSIGLNIVVILAVVFVMVIEYSFPTEKKEIGNITTTSTEILTEH